MSKNTQRMSIVQQPLSAAKGEAAGTPPTPAGGTAPKASDAARKPEEVTRAAVEAGAEKANPSLEAKKTPLQKAIDSRIKAQKKVKELFARERKAKKVAAKRTKREMLSANEEYENARPAGSDFTLTVLYEIGRLADEHHWSYDELKKLIVAKVSSAS